MARAPDPPPPAELPEAIGPYRILGRLGEGGMGVVYEAEQESPRRRVALKVVRGGAHVDALQVRLFQREADTLARLEHPGIATIHDAGRTEEGQPYFALELVRGQTLGAWLDQRPRPDRREVARRLRLLEQVCDAVQYAHQRGVIHRDLKPGNLIVVPPGEGSSASGYEDAVKVLDFGLARLTDSNDGSLATEVGVIKGTLAYMSPEQAVGDPDHIDTRTDVYSLGVLLYQTLTGRLPVDTTHASVMESLRRITEGSLPRVEQAWSGPGRLDPDLATIVHTALAREPDERYPSASALADDLRRYLASEPIQARPPSTIYQLRKLIARRKAPFAAAALFLVSLVGFAVAMSVLFTRSERNLARALEAEAEAESNFAFAQDAVDRYFTQVSESPELGAVGLESLRRELLDTAREFYADLVRRRSGDPSLRAELGAAHIRLSAIARVMGDHDDAIRRAREGIEVYAELLEEEPERTFYRRQHAILVGNLGLALADLGRDQEAETTLDEALDLDRALVDLPDALAIDRARLGNTLDNLAQLLERQGRIDEAQPLYARAVGVREALHADLPGEALHLRELVQTLNNFGILFARLGRLDEALPPLQRAIALTERLDELDPGSATDNVNAVTCGNLAGVRMLLGELESAREDYERELLLRRQLVERHPAVLDYHLFLGTVLCNLGELETRADHPATALPWFEEAVESFQRVLASTPDHATTRYSLSYTYSWNARALGALGRWPAAVAAWERAIEFDDRGDPSLREGLEAARKQV